MVVLRVNFVTLLDESFSTFFSSCYDQLRPVKVVFDVNLDLIITSLDILALDILGLLLDILGLDVLGTF